MIAYLSDVHLNRLLSPEARAAAGAWHSVSGRAASAQHLSVSGRELAAAGYTSDVEIAAEVDQQLSVAVLDTDRSYAA